MCMPSTRVLVGTLYNALSCLMLLLLLDERYRSRVFLGLIEAKDIYPYLAIFNCSTCPVSAIPQSLLDIADTFHKHLDPFAATVDFVELFERHAP